MGKSATATLEAPMGMMTVALSRVNPDVYKNPRGDSGTKQALLEMRRSLEAKGQLQCCVGCYADDGVTIALTAGWRRYTALRQNALDKLCDKHNADLTLKPSDPDYIDITSEGGVAALSVAHPTEVQEILAKTPIMINVMQVENALEALLIGAAENVTRLDMSLWALCATLMRAVDEYGMEQGKAGLAMGWQKSRTSQYISVGRLRPNMLAYIGDPAYVAMLPEDRQPKHKQLVEAIGQEWERRCKVDPNTNKTGIYFDTLRRLDEVWKKHGPERKKTDEVLLTVPATVELLGKVMRVDNGGNKAPETPSPERTVFEEYLSNAITLSKPKAPAKEDTAVETPAAEQTAAVAAAGTATPSAIDAIVAGAPAAATPAAAAATPAAAGTTAPAAAATPAATKAADVAAAATANAVSDGDTAAAILARDAAEDGDEDEGSEDAAPTSADLTAAKKAEGESGGVRKDAPEVAYNPIAPANVAKHAEELLTRALKLDHSTCIERLLCLHTSAYLYNTIGCEKEDKMISLMSDGLYEETAAYLEALEAYVKTVKEKYGPAAPTFDGLVPKIPSMSAAE